MTGKPNVTEIVAAMKRVGKLYGLVIAADGLVLGNRYALAMFRLYSKRRRRDLMELLTLMPNSLARNTTSSALN